MLYAIQGIIILLLNSRVQSNIYMQHNIRFTVICIFFICACSRQLFFQPGNQYIFLMQLLLCDLHCKHNNILALHKRKQNQNKAIKAIACVCNFVCALSVFSDCFIVAHVLWQKIFNHLIETQPSIIRLNNPCPFSTFNDHIKMILHIVVKVVLNFSKLDIYVFFACQHLFRRYFAWVMIYYVFNNI